MNIETINCIINDIEYKLHKININDQNLYKAIDIGNMLQIKTIRTSIYNYDSKYKCIVNIKTNGGNQDVLFLNEEGVKIVISKSRSIYAYDLAKFFNFNILNIFIGTIENDTLLKIITVFKNEKFILQYRCDKYKIDLYFFDYKLAIECDEDYHKNQTDNDLIRQTYIEDKLQCHFIRYSVNNKTFNIFDVIFNIYEYIKQYKIINNKIENNLLNDIPINKLQIKD
jgi:very-short-patch-repair endonuclease